ncbi:MAG: hypothetical protein LWY06_16285 [Firmicutes bacterium]|nr:hypothetical protein [Bacillota bacterium]
MAQTFAFTYDEYSSYTGSQQNIFARDAFVLKKSKTLKGKQVLLAAVADDMAPFRDGSHASELAIALVTEFFTSNIFNEFRSEKDFPGLEAAIRGLFDKINLTVFNKCIEDNVNVNLSLSAAFLVGDRMFTGHVGTGKIIRIRQGEITTISGSQSRLSQEARIRGLTVKEALSTGMSDGRLLGAGSDIVIDFKIDHLFPDDTVLVFSDGIGEFISDKEMEVILKSTDSPQGALNRFSGIAAERGLREEASVLLFKILLTDEDSKKSIGDLTERKEKRKGCSAVYFYILLFLFIIITACSVVGVHYAKKLMNNLDKPVESTAMPVEKPSPPSDEVQPTEGETPAAGSPMVALDKDCMPLNIFRINGERMDPAQEKYEITKDLNELELFPMMGKGTYNLTIKVAARESFTVLEGSSRNSVLVGSDKIEIHLTKGSYATIKPDGGGAGIAQIVMTGMGSPVIVTYTKENMIIKADKDP